jgi:hypothetical protein
MYVHVHRARVELEPQHKCGLPVVVQHVAIGLAQRMGDHPVAHEPAVDEEVLGIGARLCRLRQAREAGQREGAAARLDRHARGYELVAEEQRRALGERLPAKMAADPAVVLQRKGDFAARERDTPERLVAMPELGRLGAQELAASRRVEIEILDRHGGPLRARRRGDLAELRAFRGDRSAMRSIAGPARDRHARDRGDRSERLAAEPHRGDAFQVAKGADLAGGMPRQREGQLLARYTLAVILHLPHACRLRRAYGRLAPASMLFSISSFRTRRPLPTSPAAIPRLGGADRTSRMPQLRSGRR